MKKIVLQVLVLLTTSICFAQNQSQLDSLIQQEEEHLKVLERLDSINKAFAPRLQEVETGLRKMELGLQCSSTLRSLKEIPYSISMPFQKVSASQKTKHQNNLWNYFSTQLHQTPEQAAQSHKLVSQFIQQNDLFQGEFSITVTFPDSDEPQAVQVKSYYAIDKVKQLNITANFGSIYDLLDVITLDKKSYYANVFTTRIGQQCVCYSYDDPEMDLADRFDYYECAQINATPDL